MKKLKAITVMDVVVAMVISGIVMGMASMFYLGLVKTLGESEKTNAEVASARELFFMMRKDFDSADLIFKNEDEITFSFNTQVFSSWKIEEKYLLRDHSGIKTDTFHFIASEFTASFEKTEVPENGILDFISVELLSPLKNRYSYTWRKNYPVVTLLNLENNGR